MSAGAAHHRLVVVLWCAAALSGGCTASALAAPLAGRDGTRIPFQSLTFPTTQLLTFSREGTLSVVWGPTEYHLP